MTSRGDVPFDPYKTLQVDPEADPEVIQAAYRRLAQKWHPDLATGTEAAARMVAINRAWEVLGEPLRRAAYDLDRANAGRATDEARRAAEEARPPWARGSGRYSDTATGRRPGPREDVPRRDGAATDPATGPATGPASGVATDSATNRSRPSGAAEASPDGPPRNGTGPARPAGATGARPGAASQPPPEEVSRNWSSGRSETGYTYDASSMRRPEGTGVAGRPPGNPSGSVLNFGRYAGWSLGEIARTDLEYLEWLDRMPIGRPYRDEIDAILRRTGRRRTAAAEASDRRGLFRRR